MVTKGALVITLVTPLFVYSSLACADIQTFGIGYANSQVSTPDNSYLNGGNVNYRYEWDSPVSIIGSFTYMSGGTDQVVRYTNPVYGNHLNTWFQQPVAFHSKYFSLMLGPAYRINNYLSIYSLIGISHVSNRTRKISTGSSDGVTDMESSHERANSTTPDGTGFLPITNQTLNTNELAYGAGIEINPVKNLSVYLAYEVTTTKHAPKGTRHEGENGYINGFNIGVGYRF